MKKRKGIISIFVLLISMFACCFVFADNRISEVYSAEATTQDCYYLLGQDGNPYQANVSVGKVEGTGKFVVGESNVLLTATANSNYQIKGWQITYTEQENKTEFFDTSSLESGAKTIELTAKDGATKISATIEYFLKNNFYQTSTFKLDNVFEHLTISPVFDHVYYFVEMSELVQISTLKNETEIGTDKLYYESSSVDGEVTTYSKACIKIGEAYYYYGELFSKDGKYYTVHNELTDSGIAQEIDYSLGAFRVGDNVKTSFDVNINSEKINESKNIDLVGMSIIGDTAISLTNNASNEEVANSYKIEKDSFLRTSKYEINFDVVAHKNQKNVIDVTYHDLFVIDLEIVIDESNAHDETADIFGNTEVNANEILSNISIYNFYSRTNENNLQFLIKKIQDNNSKAFSITCSQTVQKTIDGTNYKYYDFVSLDNTTSTSLSYPSVSQNMTISIAYSSTKYEIDFICMEYVDDNGEIKLNSMSGNVLETVFKKRGEDLPLTIESVSAINNVGFKFVGYSLGDTNVQQSLTYVVDKIKPQGTTIFICFEKIEYEVVFANYNKVKIGTLTAINSINFTINNGAKDLSSTFNSTTLVGESVTLDNKLTINGQLTISQIVNEGFSILGYSLKSPTEVTAQDYFVVEEDLSIKINFDEKFITDNNIEDKIIIYVYEDLQTYTLTYFIEPTADETIGSDVIMAQIDAKTTNVAATIEKYDINDLLISEENGNLDELVAKIVVSNLNLNDTVDLSSKALTVGATTYVFNWFTENGLATLLYTKDNDVYTHTETISRSREIKVVYSMPSAKVLIALEEEFASNSNFMFDIVVECEGEENPLSPDDENGRVFVVKESGKTVTITISNLSFGYKFVGFTHQEEDVYNSEFTETETSVIFTHKTSNIVNTLVLDFERIEYRFVFTQYGAEMNGSIYTFDDGKQYAILNVDNSSVVIKKPIGYYVSQVKFNEIYTMNFLNSSVKEDNDFRHSENIVDYNFNLGRDDFINLVENFGEEKVENYVTITQVNVRLDYEIFKYQVKVIYGLTNPKGDLDAYVKYPSIELKYVYGGETRIAPIDSTTGVKTIVFMNIPYGANATMNLKAGAASGLSLKGWFYADGNNMVASNDYQNSLEYLKIPSVIEDSTFAYKLSYNAYNINVVYSSEQGQPEVRINGNLVTSQTKQITLYDQLEIKAGALASKGYGFDKITYKVPVYTQYVYDEETWNSTYSKLYILKNDTYQLNVSDQYDDTTTYYLYTEETVICDTSTFLDETFIVSDYALGNDFTITFNVEYKLINLTIRNRVVERTDVPLASLTSAGSGNAKLQFKLEEMLNISIIAVDGNNTERAIQEGDFVNFYDTITINAKINKNAVNYYDNTEYDLSLGLSLYLNRIMVSGKFLYHNSTNTSPGEYTFTFFIGNNYMPTTGDVIDIIYQLDISAKSIETTTIITSSTAFYENINLYIRAKNYGFDFTDVVSENQMSISREYQFLAKTNIDAEFKNTTYSENFTISGVKIYCNDSEIGQTDYERFGIVLNLNADGDVESVDTRLMTNVKVVFIVQPNIRYNKGPNYVKTFECDSKGVGVAQQLTVGQLDSCDIQVDDMLKDSITIKYTSTLPNSEATDNVTTVGTYKVSLMFTDTAGFDWLDEIVVAQDVTLIIVPKILTVTYNAETVEKTQKVYDGTSSYTASIIYKYLQFTDGYDLTINYADIMNSVDNNLKLKTADCYISSAGKDAGVANANENSYYNLYVYNFSLKDTDFNKNFEIPANADVIIREYIKITRKKVAINNLSVLDKVYDGTDKAQLSSTENITISNIVSGDDVSLYPNNLNIRFENASIGTNKKVIIDATTALGGNSASNYYIDTIEIQNLTIYPYNLSTTINGLGTIEIINKRGLTEQENVDLIPLNATLNVKPIYLDSQQYVAIYGNISKHVKGNNEFAIGYEIYFMVNGEDVAVDNNLYLSIPTVKNSTGTYFLTGKQTGSISYTYENGNMLIDLSQISGDVSHVFITKTKILLKAWQIVLIIVGILLIIFIIVLILIIIRKRKINRDSVHEKI